MRQISTKLYFSAKIRMGSKERAYEPFDLTYIYLENHKDAKLRNWEFFSLYEFLWDRVSVLLYINSYIGWDGKITSLHLLTFSKLSFVFEMCFTASITIAAWRFRSTDSVTGPAFKIKQSGVRIYSVGVGNYFDIKQLETMASRPVSENVFIGPFNKLQHIRDALIRSICYGRFIIVVIMRLRSYIITVHLPVLKQWSDPTLWFWRRENLTKLKLIFSIYIYHMYYLKNWLNSIIPISTEWPRNLYLISSPRNRCVVVKVNVV